MKCILVFILPCVVYLPVAASEKTLEIKYLINTQINSKSRIDFERDFFHSLPRYANEGQKISLSYIKSTMTNLRAYAEIDSERRINILMLPAKKDLEFKAIEIPIPVMKGLLGFRKVIVKKSMLEPLAMVDNIEELRAFKVGQVEEWLEAKLYRNNGFALVPAPKIENLFSMLKEGRFELLPLGLIEIERELSTWPSDTDYVIAPSIMLYYDLPVVLYVSPDRPDLAAFVHKALNKMVNDGTLDQLLNKHFGQYVKHIKNHDGAIIYLENSGLPKSIPLEKNEYWLEQVQHEH